VGYKYEVEEVLAGECDADAVWARQRNEHIRHEVRLLLTVAVAAVLLAGPAAGAEGPAQRIRKLARARTKIVWVRGSGPNVSFFGPARDNKNVKQFKVIALDTDAYGGKQGG
jgi:hypothetical protein